MKRGVDGLTDKQRELLDAIITHGDVGKACEALEIDATTAHQRLYRLRKKFATEKRFIETYARYKIRIADTKGTYL
ncbi:hypothetical protein LCGC14_2682810 [marine sediment metagenome]|uniref:HTH luxR-type domain-containing protein n=1 Tax=marine sediment metagenome TaxID=412755 RepID=A0A0F9CCJ7_9ZZZZ